MIITFNKYEYIFISRMTVLPDGTLRIMDVQKNNSGEYTCQASNIHSSDTVIYNLKVLGK